MSRSAISTEYVDSGEFISHDPARYHGWPCIGDTRVPVHILASFVAWGWSVERIAQERTDLPLPWVLAGLAFYYANRERIDLEIEDATEGGTRLAQESWAAGERAPERSS
jgi:uncharacterized protein (DUF433 family)